MSTETAHFLLYIKGGCPWCRMAEDYLTEHGYRYERIDVTRDRAAYNEMRRVSDQTYAPTLVVGDLVLPDFGPDELAEFLEQHNLKP
jgi:glutaredoxin 3